ncbi:hypothetical protein [Aurantiacibacter sp. D1-12]|uniref:hypothetical protein n=1 Tax=Aurantiacibacter sp. D1-12 TaxID=2993658 RepID=UPI00237C8A39|nr:hypothetical protein [Aurantiacibacter sp. D1-12]MDE1467418.1 hypothetical protein [Aurantiacibacter sp. D1-12]
MMRRALPLFALGAVLSSCSDSRGDRGPDPATADEARALSQAAEMLEERPREDAPQAAPSDEGSDPAD